MAVLVRPRSWGLQKPPVGSQINWGHPLARGLACCLLFNEQVGAVHDLVASDLTLAPGATTSWGADGLFSGATGGVTSNCAAGTMPGRLKFPDVNATLLWRGKLVGNVSGVNSSVLHCSFNNAAGSPFDSLGDIYRIGGNNDQIACSTNNGGSFVNVATGAGLSLSLSGRYNVPLMLTLTLAPNLQVIYDGAKLAGSSTTALSAPTFSATSEVVVGAFEAVSGAFSNSVTWSALIYHRPLTAGEVAWLDAEPYAFINPPGPKVLYYDLSVGGVSNPLSVSGSITPSGALSDSVQSHLAGSITGSGTVQRQSAKALTGSIAASGTVTRSVAKILAGSLSPAGTIKNVINKAFAGALTLVGVLTPTRSGTVQPDPAPYVTYHLLEGRTTNRRDGRSTHLLDGRRTYRQ